MGKIIRYNEYELNEGVKEKMTPKDTTEIKEIIKKIIDNPSGNNIFDAVNVINSINKVGFLPYLDDDDLEKIVKMALSDSKLMQHDWTGRHENFIWFVNYSGNGLIIINQDNNKIFEVGLFAAKEVITALKQLL